jgi:hypothetical protein
MSFQGAPNQVAWLGWRWMHHELVVVTIQRRVLGIVPFKGKWRKRYREMV